MCDVTRRFVAVSHCCAEVRARLRDNGKVAQLNSALARRRYVLFVRLVIGTARTPPPPPPQRRMSQFIFNPSLSPAVRRSLARPLRRLGHARSSHNGTSSCVLTLTHAQFDILITCLLGKSKLLCVFSVFHRFRVASPNVPGYKINHHRAAL